MPNSTQERLSSKVPPSHEWTSEQTYELLDQIQSNPIYTQNFFPTPGHTPGPGILEYHARSLCVSILEDTRWMSKMKSMVWIRVKAGKYRFGKRWVGDDPVTVRLRELPDMAKHYEERLGGCPRYEDIPEGSGFAKRWRKYERCPERKWVLKYIALKRIQADNSKMVSDGSLELESNVIPIPEPANTRGAGGEGSQSSTPMQGSESRKRTQTRPEERLSATKRARPCRGGSPTTRSPVSARTAEPIKQIDVIVISDSDEDEDEDVQSLIHPRPARQTRRSPSAIIIDSDSDVDSDSNSNSIRSVSPPITTLPFRRFALSPTRLLPTSQDPTPVRQTFQEPPDVTPTDSEDESEPEKQGPFIEFTSIELTTPEDLEGMFRDPNLRPQQAWRFGLLTPPDSRASGSASPIKQVGEGSAKNMTPESESAGEVEEDMDMDDLVDTNPEAEVTGEVDLEVEHDPSSVENLDFDAGLEDGIHTYERVDQDRPNTPVRPSTTSPSDNRRPLSPSLPNHTRSQGHSLSIHGSRVSESDEEFSLQTDEERDIAARLLRTLTEDQGHPQLVPSHSTHEVVYNTRIQPSFAAWDVDNDTTSALGNWIADHTQNSSVKVRNKARRRRPSLESAGSGNGKGKGKQVEVVADRQVYNTNSTEDTSYPVASTSTIKTTQLHRSEIQPSSSPSIAKSEANKTHQDTFKVGSLLADISIALVCSTPQPHLSDYSIAFNSGHIPLKSKLCDLIEVLGGEVIEQHELRSRRNTPYIIHPVGYPNARTINRVEHIDILGFMGIILSKIQESR